MSAMITIKISKSNLQRLRRFAVHRREPNDEVLGKVLTFIEKRRQTDGPLTEEEINGDD